MILTRTDIKSLIDSKGLVFNPPLDQYQNQPHAIDLRLGTTFYIPKIWEMTENGRQVVTVDVTKSGDKNYEIVNLKPGQFFELAPGESIIASTLEHIELNTPDVMGILYPRSSINRRGLSVDLTGIVDVFYSGSLMIPILNKTSSQIIRIYPGERICQMVLQKLTSDIDKVDALRHGVVPAKYEGCGDADLCLKKDAEEELEMIKRGDLEGLKNVKYE